MAVEISPKRTATADQMSNDLIHYFGELSLGNQTRQVVLLVDEMQRLSLHQFEAFAELYDSLQTFESNLSVIFVGNESESSPTIKSVKSSSYELIRGRFFNHNTKYLGITKKREVNAILKEFDDWVIDEKTTTEYFLPKLYKVGWRYASLSDLIWNVYKSDFKKIHNFESWPLQYFIRTAKILLTDYLKKYGIENQNALRRMVYQSIIASQILGKIDFKDD